jgi:hypothetical protein
MLYTIRSQSGGVGTLRACRRYDTCFTDNARDPAIGKSQDGVTGNKSISLGNFRSRLFRLISDCTITLPMSSYPFYFAQAPRVSWLYKTTPSMFHSGICNALLVCPQCGAIGLARSRTCTWSWDHLLCTFPGTFHCNFLAHVLQALALRATVDFDALQSKFMLVMQILQPIPSEVISASLNGKAQSRYSGAPIQVHRAAFGLEFLFNCYAYPCRLLQCMYQSPQRVKNAHKR